MEYALLGWPEDGPTLRLDHEVFSYAGKFVMSNTGKAVVREARPEEGVRSGERGEERPAGGKGGDDWGEYDDDIVAAVAFNEDRSDGAAWLRYVTVRRDRRGEGIGARLSRFASDRLLDAGYDEVRIAVNNVFAYEALHKAGFGFTGRETGIAELVLARPGDRSRETYRRGLDVFRARDGLSDPEVDFLASKEGSDPPAVLAGAIDGIG